MKRVDNSKVMSVKEFSNQYNIGINKAYELINIAGFPAIRFGRKVIIIRSKVQEWIEGQIGKTL